MRPQGSPIRRLVFAIIAIFLLAVVVGVGWLTNVARVARAQARAWHEERSEARIVGKTADEIVATFGKPYAAERGPDGKPAFIMYKQVKHGQYCGIAIKDGVAVNVSFSFQ